MITGEQPLAITGSVRLEAIDRPVAINGTLTATVQVDGAVTVKDTTIWGQWTWKAKSELK